jgi:hypothetical protein
MTNKEIAARLRSVAKLESSGSITKSRLHEIADELDPPRPEPGTVVWWKFGTDDDEYRIGQVNDSGTGVRGVYWNSTPAYWKHIDYKPARILAPDEVAVKVPPVEEWTPNATAIGVYMSYGDSGCVKLRDVITRAEAEAREVSDD